MARFLDRIQICDFRGFPGPLPEELNLGGRHLLLYGENGSGKSSVFHAVSDLLDLSVTARPFNSDLSDPHCLKNRFTDPDLDSGRVTIHFRQGQGPVIPELNWPIGFDRPTTHVLFVAIARALGSLDYRSILRTHFLQETRQGINLFDLLIEELLTHIEMPGSTTLFGEDFEAIQKESVEYSELLKKDPSSMDDLERQSYGLEGIEEDEEKDDEEQRTWGELWSDYLADRINSLTAHVSSFNEALVGRIAEIAQQANQFVRKFDATLRINLTYSDPLKPLSLVDENWRDWVRLTLTANYFSHDIEHPGVVLNEARLTAIALSIYLAALKVETPEAAGKAIEFPKLLVLDDVLIGLDMANRLPALDLVKEEFADKGWQVLLMTFDRAWYDVARQRLDGDKWARYELYAVRVGDHERPVIKEDSDHLLRALAFLEAGEVKAAAVHVRTEFELVLKDGCSMFNLAVKYNPNPRKVPASDLWSALKSATKEFAPPVASAVDAKGIVHSWQPANRKLPCVPKQLVEAIDHSLSWVLNPLSHSESVESYRKEIEDAIWAVDRLRSRVQMITGSDFHLWLEQMRLITHLLRSPAAALLQGLSSATETKT